MQKIARRALGSFLMMMTVLLPSPGLAVNFPDMKQNWAEPYVDALSELQMIGGFPGGRFQPDDPITRAQFAAIAAKALELSGGTSAFKDVPANYWSRNAIAAASGAGLITGFPDGTFRPEQPLTRAQALVILAKALGDAAPESPAVYWYEDSDLVPGWALPLVNRAATARIIVNKPENRTLIAPDRPATRSEVAAFMYQTLTDLGKVKLTPLSIGLNPRDERGLSLTTADVIPREATPQQPIAQELPAARTKFSAGERVQVRAVGTAGARTSFTIEGVAPVPMPEVQPGVYIGSYTVTPNDRKAGARLTVTLTKPGFEPRTRVLSEPINLGPATSVGG